MTVQTRGTELIGRTLGGRYRLRSLIGTGASAGVYLAEDTSLRRRVAVKVLHPGLAHDPAFQRRFRAEARAAASLGHPHILAVHDWGEADGAFLVTELLEGGSLQDLLASGERLNLSQALVVGLHAAQGLQYAHRHGFVHRDIKPANLLFDRDERLRIGDFGIARAVAEAAWTEPEGVLVGTARYAAPEQASAGPVDGRADVYSLALTLIEAVTGEVPLVGETPLATIVLRQTTPVPVPDALGPLAEPLRRAGRVDPAERLTAEELATALLAAATSLERPPPLPLPGLPVGGDTPAGPAPEGSRAPQSDTDVLPLVPPAVEGSPTPAPAAPAAGAGPGPSTPPAAGPAVAPDRVFDVDHVDPPATGAEPRSGRRRRRWPWVALLLLVVLGAGAGAGYWQWERTRIPTYEVASYVGGPVDDVRADAARNGWLLLESVERRDGTTAGEVLSQAPDAGLPLAEGAELAVTVSEGQLLRAVPALAGTSEADAVAALVDAGLAVGSVTPEHSEDVPAGTVLSASADEGAELETGEAVDLVVSAGPAPRIVPDVASGPPADAVAALEALGLVPEVVEEYSDQVAEGAIISMDPAAGTPLERGATVRLVVSLGRPFVVVPDVVGLSAADASDRLEAAGFVVVDTVGPPNRPVLVTDPPAGERFRKGKTVTIITRSS